MYSVESLDSQGLNCQMQVIAIWNITLDILLDESFMDMTAYQGLFFTPQCAKSVKVFFIKHGKMLSDYRDAGLEQKWPRMADENLPTNLLIFCYLVKKTPHELIN